MNLTCFYCQTPFTLSMDQKIAALRKMHAENMHHYDAHCPRCGRANAISRERLEMFTPGWEEAIKEPAPMTPVSGMPAAEAPSMAMPSPVPSAPAKKAAPARRRHAPAAKKKAPAKKTAAKKAPAKKKTASKPKKTTAKAKSKSAGRKTAKKRK